MRFSVGSSVFAAVLLVASCEHPAKTDGKPGSDTPVAEPVVAPAPPPANRPQVFLSTPSGEIPVEVEVVSTEAKIERGLMYRQNLPLDAGMLFLLPVTKDWTFWMHNTLIPLDMIFIRPAMTIAGIVENAEPKTETIRTVGEPSRYVLEVNGGWTKAHGVVKDAKVRFANVPDRPAPPAR
ncbi:MAG: DUF192 domain-containing protein [Kofleriaceae bacterium]